MSDWKTTRHERPDGSQWARLYHLPCGQWTNLGDTETESIDTARGVHQCGPVPSPWASKDFDRWWRR